MLLHQLSYAIKNQLKAPKAPYLGLWDEMPPSRGISCLSLVLYGIRRELTYDIVMTAGYKHVCS